MLNPMEAKAWVRGVRNRSRASNLAPNGPDWEGFAPSGCIACPVVCLSKKPKKATGECVDVGCLAMRSYSTYSDCSLCRGAQRTASYK